MENTNEIWKPIPGYEGHYEVSSHGRVRSLDRTVQRKDGQTQRLKGRMMALKKTRNGYFLVGLRREGEKQRFKLVHRLVLEAFVGPCPDGMETLHGDGNPENNRLSNLHWGSLSENNLDTVKHGRHVNANKTHCPRGHELLLENTTESGRKDGRRRCLACHRARNRVRHHPELRNQLQQVSDRYYQAIIEEGA